MIVVLINPDSSAILAGVLMVVSEHELATGD